MRRIIVSAVNSFDNFIAHSLVNLGIEKKSLISLLFHAIVQNDDELKSGLIKPNYVVSSNFLSNIIEYFLSNGYVFITPHEIIRGLNEDKKYVLLNFDDGYFNNTIALSILEKFKVPATFFISSSFVENYKSFWWDVIYRERIKRNTPSEKINEEFKSLELRKINFIENYLVENFGIKSMDPVCDIDRPFSFSELKNFSENNLVTLGNHTSNHAVLTILERHEIIEEFTACRKFLKSISDKSPEIISYPMGWFNQAIAELSKEYGFKLGFTVNEQKNYFPLKIDSIDALLLNRFTPLSCNDMKNQLLDYRTDFHIKKVIKRIFYNKVITSKTK